VNLLLTDYLTCPRCRSGIGLVLLADRVSGRHVEQGQLGCPNCQAQFPITGGIADFGAPDPVNSPQESANALELAALLGITEGPAVALMLGRYEHVAGALAELLRAVEFVVGDAAARTETARDSVSALRIADAVPLRDQSMRGVVVARTAHHLVGEAARVCAIAARVVVNAPGPVERARLNELGMRVVMEQNETLIAVRQS
jgi:uncharacterized protein YbaR (Trm112 family)